ncbi:MULTISPECIES: metal ABC transporter substrate-binding protein [Kosmotoga]|uniref:Periplasmic solute binding protein n=1 Tax=Kosmotoga olearia (strain ATCC BAA-1733 / DSM 21960 / TBF 19.5.1) TaxID=521045 RepID=C5CIE1_KOSOT|nr:MULTISPECIES: metal ABC transporter substrate-binding protein [Kosmotoga]ACR78875.1 periplasmic solute binding protein [Kosmotoga olearia TBF 19.5.1]OAA24856.1 hypothetical protein DU53_00625 [Kosmotoga sp. DU53]
MKKLSVFIAWIIIMASLGFSLNVVTTINPYYLIVKEIVGDKGNVELLIPAGQNPHIYSPKMSDVKKLFKADIVVANGLGLENFLLDTLKDLEKRGKPVVYAGEFVPMGMLISINTEHDTADHTSVNPHVWLDPVLLSEYIVPGIVKALSKISPANKEFFAERANLLIDDLMEFHRKVADLLAPFSGKAVIVAHPSFEYFFNRYGIEERTIFSGHGDEPSISELKVLINFARKNTVFGIFGEYQQNKKPVEIIAKSTGLPLSELDPLGFDKGSIIELLSWNLNQIERVIHGAR